MLVQLGDVRHFSDITGRHYVRLDNSPEKRHELAQRLATAGCSESHEGVHWLSAGDFTPPPPPESMISARPQRAKSEGVTSFQHFGLCWKMHPDFFQYVASTVQPNPIKLPILVAGPYCPRCANFLRRQPAPTAPFFEIEDPCSTCKAQFDVELTRREFVKVLDDVYREAQRFMDLARRLPENPCFTPSAEVSHSQRNQP